MRLLIYQRDTFLEQDIFNICKEKGIGYKTFRWEFEDRNVDEKFLAWFQESIDICSFDVLLSINYWPLLSQVCQEHGTKYIAWCCDNPLSVVRIEETLANPVNSVFLFDRVQCRKYKDAGFDTVYHLPLAVNKTRMEKLVVSAQDVREYAADVAFMGSLYESQLPEIMAPLNDYVKGFLDALIKAQYGITGSYLLDDWIQDELIEEINRQYLKKEPNTKIRMSREALSYAMACEVTRRDRIVLLSLCGERFDTRLYSQHDSKIIQKVKRHPPVNYWTEMHQVFSCSKINLNPSLRIIQTGIPLRAFDVLGAGGFLLSNYQEELLELFEDGKELAVYESPEDAVEKIDFYLRHEELRAGIAKRGKKKTLEEHSIQRRLDTIMKIAGI